MLRAFRDTSGSEPEVRPLLDAQRLRARRRLRDSIELRRYQTLFGRFNVYVAGPEGPGTVRQMMAGAPVDRDGVRWRLVSTQGQAVWVALKRYGANVVLSWIAPSTDRTLDERWQRLDRMLRSLATF